MAKTRPTQTARSAPSRQDQAAGDADDEEWAIEVGAFAQQNKAQQVAQATLTKLGKLAEDGEAKAALQKKGRHAIYRARIVGLSKGDAQQACHRLAKHHQHCQPLNLG